MFTFLSFQSLQSLQREGGEGGGGGGVHQPTISENIKQPVEVTCQTVGFGLQTFGSLFLFYHKSHISTPRLRAGSCIKHIWTVFSQHFNPKLMSYNLKNCRTVPAIMMHSTSKLWRLRDVKFSDFSTQQFFPLYFSNTKSDRNNSEA